MRILLVSGEYPPRIGGVSDYSACLVQALRQQGQDVQVLTSSGDDLDAPGPMVWNRVSNWSYRSWPIVASALSRWHSDVLHLQYQPGAFQLSGAVNLLPWWLRLRSSGVRTVVTFHDLRVPYLFPKAGPLRTLAVQALLRGSDAAIFVDPADLARAGPGRARRWVPIGSNIPCMPSVDFDRPTLRGRLGVAPGDLLIGYFGFLSASKGADTLLRALALMRDAGAPVRLVLIGASANPRNDRDRVDEMAAMTLSAQLGLGSLVQSTGYLSSAEVSAHLLACDVVALPYVDGASFRRGSLLAALEHGCAVVTTPPVGPAVGIGDRRFESGRHFLSVAPDDPAALAAALTQLESDGELRARLGGEARRLAALCSWPSIASETIGAYQEAMAG